MYVRLRSSSAMYALPHSLKLTLVVATSFTSILSSLHPHQVVGFRIGSLLESMTALLLSLGIAFGYSWLTAAVILGFLPVMVLANLLNFSLVTGNAGRSQRALQSSTEVSLAQGRRKVGRP